MNGYDADRFHAVVIGAGITGLAAALELADARVSVTVVETRSTVGGQLRTRVLEGQRLDVGAESLHLAASGPVTTLLWRLALDGEVVDAARASSWLATARGLRKLPAGVGPAGPTRLGPVVGSRILSPAGLVRAACEPLVRDRLPPNGDTSVGAYLTGRFGRQVTERLVDPLLGNLHAGSVDRLSLAVATPMLDAAARRRRSLTLGRRTAGTQQVPRFVTLPGGLTTITDAIAADPRLAITTGDPAERIVRLGDGTYRIDRASGGSVGADAVILAVPAVVATRLLRALEPSVASGLARLRAAGVTTVLASYERDDVTALPPGNGVLVPSTAGCVLKAATFLSAKWPHLRESGRFLVRLSAGRLGDGHLDQFDDHRLVARLHADLADLTGVSNPPRASVVQR